MVIIHRDDSIMLGKEVVKVQQQPLERQLRELFINNSHPLVQYEDAEGRKTGIANSFYFEAGLLVIVFEWLWINEEIVKNQKAIFNNPLAFETGEILRINHGLGRQIAITNLLHYKFGWICKYEQNKKIVHA